ncbi:MAG: hypothetical protein B7C24_08940 [Bacteroidetes bacterium 4572_77]|nr:MAG: hypothetical protein B7C24_08940 [Bacteroidetes bacterium 4572_77]
MKDFYQNIILNHIDVYYYAIDISRLTIIDSNDKSIGIGNDFLEEMTTIIHPEDISILQSAITTVSEKIKQAKDTKGLEKISYRQLDNNGALLWMEMSFLIMKDPENSPNKILCISKNDTKNRKEKLETQDKLVTEHFFGNIIRNSSQAICIIKPDGHFELLNETARELFGYKENMPLEKNWFTDITPLKWRHRERNNLDIAIKQRKSFSYKKEIIHKSSRRIPVELLVRPEFDKDELLFFVAFINNIEEINKTQQLLIESNERLGYALKGSNDGLWDWNTLTNYLYFSPRYLEMLGYTEKELKPHFSSFTDLVHPDDLPQVFKDHKEYLEDKTNRFESEFRMKHKKGHWLPILSRSYKITNKKGEVIRFVGTHLDLSEKKKYENDIIYALEKAEENDRLKSAFLANMSHEIRTPLNGIIGFAEILKETDDDFSEEEKSSYIDIIHSNGRILLHLVNDIIDISKIETGQLQIHPIQTNLYDLIHKATMTFEDQIAEKQLQLYLPDINKDLNIITDPTRLTQILTNILSNALKFTRKGYIRIGFEETQDEVKFSIEDTGCGINNKVQGLIYNRFAQGRPESDQILGGTGLGLSITKGLIDLLQGEIWLKSTENKGTTFFFRLKKTLQ